MLNIFFINIYNANTYGIQVNFSTPYMNVRYNHLMLDECFQVMRCELLVAVSKHNFLNLRGWYFIEV